MLFLCRKIGLAAVMAILLFSLSGCALQINSRFFGGEPTREDTQEGGVDFTATVEAVAEAPSPIPFTILYVDLEIDWAIYEPPQGAYLGAWLQPHVGKRDFEQMVDAKHASFVLEHTIGDDFPTIWVLQSIAAQAVPVFVLKLPGNYDYDFPLAELAAFAHELGNFNLPAFIVFNPLMPNASIDPDDYVLLFRYTRILFRSHAPMAAFVWHGYENTTSPESPFYPGHDMVDWVSIDVLSPQTADGFYIDIPTELLPFYMNFQRYKPIMVLPLGVGHFSRRDYVYRVPQAAEEITRVMGILRDSFPRVRMVVYANSGVSTPEWDNFSLLREPDLIYAYRSVASDDHFLERVIPGSTEGPMLMRSVMHGYYYGGNVFIDREFLTLTQRLPIPNADRVINGRGFVSTSAIDWLKIITDHSRRVIYLS